MTYRPIHSFAVIIALLVTLVGVTRAEAAGSGKVICGGVHAPRNMPNGQEMFDTSYTFRNANLARPADVRITRLTIRNFFGELVGDFGDAATPATPLPTNKDIAPSFNFDITTVPPGASYYLTTTNIYGNAFLPTTPSGGNSISAVIEFVTDGDPELFIVAGSLRVRQLAGGVQLDEHSRVTLTCQRLK